MKQSARKTKSLFVLALSFALVATGVAFTPAQADGADRTLIIHYSRTTLDPSGTAANGYCDEDPCGLYDGWNLWIWQSGDSDSGNTGTWGAAGSGWQFDPADQDKYGAKAIIPVTNKASTKVGFIVRIGSSKNDVPEDRFIDLKPTGTTEVWLKPNDSMIYTANPDDRVLRIHYNRSDNKYAGWDLLTQEENPADNKPVPFSSVADCYGKVAILNLPEITQTQQKFILRKGGDALTYQSEVFTVDLSPKKFTDFWLDAELVFGEDAVIDKPVGDKIVTYLDMKGSLTNPNGNLVAVHYSRPLQDYTGWKINHLGTGASYTPTLKDDFGRIACVYEPDQSAQAITITISKGSEKDLAVGEPSTGLGGQRTIDIKGSMTEVWIKKGNKDVSTTVIVPDVAIKQTQSLGKVPVALKSGKSVALPLKTNAKLAVKWTVITPANCSIKAGKLIGKSKGTCKLGAMQAGSPAYKLYTNQFRIAIN